MTLVWVSYRVRSFRVGLNTIVTGDRQRAGRFVLKMGKHRYEGCICMIWDSNGKRLHNKTAAV